MRARERDKETVSHYRSDSMEFVEHFDWLSVGPRPRDLFTRYPMAKVMMTRTQGWTNRDPETFVQDLDTWSIIERERRFQKFNCMESVEHFDWLSLGSRPGDVFTRYPLAKIVMTRTKSWTTRDPETVFCFLSRKWDPHVLQDLDTLGQKKVHEFQDLSCEEAS